jgi:hypothetical protein
MSRGTTPSEHLSSSRYLVIIPSMADRVLWTGILTRPGGGYTTECFAETPVKCWLTENRIHQNTIYNMRVRVANVPTIVPDNLHGSQHRLLSVRETHQDKQLRLFLAFSRPFRKKRGKKIKVHTYRSHVVILEKLIPKNGN